MAEFQIMTALACQEFLIHSCIYIVLFLSLYYLYLICLLIRNVAMMQSSTVNDCLNFICMLASQTVLTEEKVSLKTMETDK